MFYRVQIVLCVPLLNPFFRACSFKTPKDAVTSAWFHPTDFIFPANHYRFIHAIISRSQLHYYASIDNLNRIKLTSKKIDYLQDKHKHTAYIETWFLSYEHYCICNKYCTIIGTLLLQTKKQTHTLLERSKK